MSAVAVSDAHITALNKAKIQLMSKEDSVFFTTLCFSLRHRWSEKIPTAAADSSRMQLLFNPEFFMSLTAPQQVFLMIHETMHIAYLHTERFQEGMNKAKANIAMDHVINLQLLERGFQMPPNGHADPQFKGMAWEEVYKLLPDDNSKPQMADVGQESEGDDGVGKPSLTPEEVQREVDDMLIRASIQSKMAGDKPGTIPGSIQLYLDNLLDPKLPWHRLLAKYLNQFDKSDYSWKKPNRRYFPKHYLPSLYGMKLIDLAIAVDISGSVSDHDFKVFVTEVASIFRMMKPDKITLIQFDTQLQHVNEVRSINELLSLQFTGRGGTYIEPVMQWAQEKTPQLLMVFSDGEFSMPAAKPKSSEVLWLIHNNASFTPPFGKTIHYKI